jgi:hypothetical protein
VDRPRGARLGKDQGDHTFGEEGKRSRKCPPLLLDRGSRGRWNKRDRLLRTHGAGARSTTGKGHARGGERVAERGRGTVSLGAEHDVVAAARLGRRRRQQGAGPQHQSCSDSEPVPDLPHYQVHKTSKQSFGRCLALTRTHGSHNRSTILGWQRVRKEKSRNSKEKGKGVETLDPRPRLLLAFFTGIFLDPGVRR